MTPGARPTSLLFVNQHYWPDVASTGQHLTDLAEHLVAEGYRVEVLASRGRYTAGTMAAPLSEERNGVRIRRVRTTAFGRTSHLGRLVDYASYYVHLIGALFGRRRHDAVIFLTTPPLLPFIGAIARRLRGQRYGIWSMDLHPDAEFAAGMLKRESLLGRFLDWANRLGYRAADLVVDLGPYMKRRILDYGADVRRTRTVHVWSSKEEIEPTAPDQNPVRRELGLADRFVVMYSGNAGIVHDFDAILEAMRRLKDDPRIYFLFVGDGPQRKRIERFAAEQGITNFSYRAYFPREQLRWSLSVADVHLISLRPPFVGISVPGKLYGIMASGRPALFVGPERCESAETIVEARCGAVVDPTEAEEGGDPAGRIVELLQGWAARPEEARTLGANGRKAFLERYEREPNCEAFARYLRATWPVAAGANERDPRGGQAEHATSRG